MKQAYLEVTFRRGKPLAAYVYLPRPAGTKSARTVERRPTILVDYAADGKPIGVELTAPGATDVAAVNEVLREIGADPLPKEDLAPLKAA